jgi:hypothetical protein
MQATDSGRRVSGSDNIFRIGNLRQAWRHAERSRDFGQKNIISEGMMKNGGIS